MRIIINKRLKPTVDTSTMELFKTFYADSQFDSLKEIFVTYHNRGGRLHFREFAKIPISRDPGDITRERGEWTKFIRKRMAYDWNALAHIK